MVLAPSISDWRVWLFFRCVNVLTIMLVFTSQIASTPKALLMLRWSSSFHSFGGISNGFSGLAKLIPKYFLSKSRLWWWRGSQRLYLASQTVVFAWLAGLTTWSSRQRRLFLQSQSRRNPPWERRAWISHASAIRRRRDIFPVEKVSSESKEAESPSSRENYPLSLQLHVVWM